MTRSEECIEMLKQLITSSSVMPDYICRDENYPEGKTTVLENIRLDSFEFVISEAIRLLGGDQ